MNDEARIKSILSEANSALVQAKHALKYHVDYDYDTHQEYRAAMEKYKGEVLEAEIKLERLKRIYPEYFL